MSRAEDGSLKHFVTFRITDDGKEILEDLITAHRTSIPTLMRILIKEFSEETGDFGVSHLSAKLRMEKSYIFRVLTTFEQRG